jgi:hypothetical protein
MSRVVVLAAAGATQVSGRLVEACGSITDTSGPAKGLVSRPLPGPRPRARLRDMISDLEIWAESDHVQLPQATSIHLACIPVPLSHLQDPG